MGSMFMNKEKVMEQVKQLPAGAASQSNKYWCMTCKMLFSIDEPVCPYMSKVCINTPIAVEQMKPKSTESIEKFGLFYPKIPQILMARLAKGNANQIADKWVKAYIDFLEDWSFDMKENPYQIIRSFIIFITGSVTGQRVNKSGVSYVVTDPGKIWDGELLMAILHESIKLLKKKLGIQKKLDIVEMDISGDAPYGKYYCPMCRKFFEFSHQRDTVTCPIMAQKCMATPQNIETIKYKLEYLAEVYEYTPDFYRRFIQELQVENGADILKEILIEDWQFEIEEDAFHHVARQLGVY